MKNVYRRFDLEGERSINASKILLCLDFISEQRDMILETLAATGEDDEFLAEIARRDSDFIGRLHDMAVEDAGGITGGRTLYGYTVLRPA